MCTYACSQSIERAGAEEREAGVEEVGGYLPETAVGAHDDMTKHLDWVEAWLAILQRNLQSVDNTHTHTGVHHTHTCHIKRDINLPAK